MKNFQAWVRLEGKEDRKVVCINISKGGLYFLFEDELIIGSKVDVRFGKGLFLHGEILRVDRLDEGVFGFAIKFTGFRTDEKSGGNGVFQLELAPINDQAFQYYRRLRRLLEHIESKGTEGMTLSDAANIANMERTYFSDFFHNKVGVTFSSWIQYLRVSKALEMLRDENCSVTEIAFESGFNDLSTFHKAFKRWTSLSPREVKSLVRPA